MGQLHANAKKIGLLLLLIGLFSRSYAKTSKVAQLQMSLATISDSISYVDKINRIAFLMHLKAPDSTLLYAIKAKETAERIQYPKGKASALCNIATVLAVKGLYRESIVTFSQALNIYRQRKENIRWTINMLNNIAVVYDALGDSAKAQLFSGRAISTGKQIAMDSAMSLNYINYVYFHPEFTKDSTDFYLNKAETIATNFNDERSRIVIAQQMAAKFLRSADRANAKRFLDDAWRMTRKTGWEYHQIVTLRYLAKYYMLCEKPDEALKYSREGLRLAEAQRFPIFRIQLLRQQRQILKKMGASGELNDVNRALVDALTTRIENNKQFLVDYIAFLNQTQKLGQVQRKWKSTLTGTYTLMIILLVSVIVVIYTICLNKKLCTASEKLKALHRQVETKNASLREETRAKEGILVQLRLAHKKINRQCMIRTHILSAVSHDIRTPMKYVLFVAEHLQRIVGKQNLVTVKEAIESIVASTRKILQLQKNMILYSKVLYHEGDITFARVNLTSLVEGGTEMFAKLALARQCTFIIEIDEWLNVYTNPDLFGVLLHNLLDNTLKFSSPGHLHIRGVLEGEAVVLTLQDSGPGFKDLQLQWINHPSTSLEVLSPQHHEIGLGLIMVKELSTILNIQLAAENNNGARILLKFDSEPNKQ